MKSGEENFEKSGRAEGGEKIHLTSGTWNFRAGLPKPRETLH